VVCKQTKSATGRLFVVNVLLIQQGREREREREPGTASKTNFTTARRPTQPWPRAASELVAVWCLHHDTRTRCTAVAAGGVFDLEQSAYEVIPHTRVLQKIAVEDAARASLLVLGDRETVTVCNANCDLYAHV
jgi:hypothetical protein